MILRKITGLFLVMVMITFLSLGCSNKNEQPQPNPETQQSSAKQKAKELNCKWTIAVNDTITVNNQGLPITYTLNFSANKNGGTQPIGTYTGKAALTMKSDFSKIPGMQNKYFKISGGADGQGTDNKIKLDIGWTSKNTQENPPAGEDPLAPLTPPEGDPDIIYVGDSTMNLSGLGSITLSAKGIQGENANIGDSKKSSGAVPYSVKINGASVEITIQKAGTFKGTLTGTPLK